MLTKNEIKGIIKGIRLLENSGNLLIGTTTRTTCQEEGFLDFLGPLMSAGIP